ncbi:MAG: MFS transporter [Verrucomicrobiota bacterium]|jgi:acyl-[acyl-carrier-protein]-phospholipid O-acyltransferase/long-chain-fatty-acid--[acyl-carrier-protein] ligase|nr:MFS transporter [Verrucomicrobiota bacterium]
MQACFKWLNLTQAIGALIDNAVKMVAVFFLVTTLDREMSEALAFASALLVLPFLLFSNLAGALTDRYSKRTLVVAVKWAELGLLLLGFPALAADSPWPILAVLFLLAAQSAFFGPVKRGIVPELVAPEDLARANGQMTGACYIAIIFGLFLPSFAVTALELSYAAVLAGCVGLSLVGLLCAYRLPPTPAANRVSASSPWIVPDAVRALRSLAPDVWLKRAALGSIAFSGVAALFQQNLVVYARELAALPVESSGYLFLLVAVGIALGAWLTGRLSPHTIELGLIPVGAAGLALALIGLGLVSSRAAMAPLLVLAGGAAGLCIVPITAFLQARAPAHNRGEIFGAVEFWSFAAMVAASGLFYGLFNVLHVGPRACMLLTGCAGLAAAGWALALLPGHAMRFLVSRLTRLLYRVEVHGLENLPREGGALLVANHVAYGDAPIIQSVIQRPVRYVMSRDIFKGWGWCRPVFKLTGAIPLQTGDGPRALVQALNNARDVLRGGALVGIFPEGRLSRTGGMAAFRKGFERIAQGTGCPIIPIHLDNLWDSIFSFRHGEPALRWPRRLPLRVTVRIGKPLPSTASAEDVRQAVAELGAETSAARAAQPGNTLAHRFVKQARRAWLRPIVRDTLGQSATYGRLLSGAVALGRRLAPQLAGDSRVGVLLPPSVAGVLANTALTLQGRTVVNLNWTVSPDAFRSAVRQSGLSHIVTSRRFIAAVTLPETSARLVFLEDALAGLTLREKAAALLRARFASPRALAAYLEPAPADTACVIFSSGSTGTPKGVMLSHANLLANLDALLAILPVTPRDTLCATLPLFHSFGYLGTVWYPLLAGIPTVFHANPLQTAHVLRLIRDARATTLLTTPTLLQAYLRRSAFGELKALRHVFTGGEKLPAALADAFEQATGLRPLEGYGATELAPVVAMGLPQGGKRGSVGRPLPNIALKTVDPDTGLPLPPGAPGLLLVKGPNVMQGYLGDAAKTAAVLRDGWYNTGDIARIDEDGFLFLTDRLSRFSKIGGEMVPHGAVEEALQNACGFSEQPCVAVVGIPVGDAAEALAVCYTPQAGDAETLFAALKHCGLPNLWIPSRDHFIPVADIPLLGTGKTDLRALRDAVLRARRLCA